MAIERFEIDTEQWAVVPKEFVRLVQEAYDAAEVGLSFESCKYLLKFAQQELVAAAPRPEAGRQTNSVYMCPDHGSGVYVGLPSYPAGCCFVCGKRPEAGRHVTADEHSALNAALRDSVRIIPRPAQIADLVEQAHAHLDIVEHEFNKMFDSIKTHKNSAPILTSERWPTKADADVYGNVWAFSEMFINGWELKSYDWVAGNPNTFKYWQPTGLQRPAEPDGGAV